MASIDDQPRMASARAVRHISCIVLPKNVLAHKLDEADLFLRDLLFVLAAGLRKLTEKLLLARRGADS
jgi:CRP/FNR family cyclic AMP-dependent transcriptional regulator